MRRRSRAFLRGVRGKKCFYLHLGIQIGNVHLQIRSDSVDFLSQVNVTSTVRFRSPMLPATLILPFFGFLLKPRLIYDQSCTLAARSQRVKVIDAKLSVFATGGPKQGSGF